MFDSVRVKAELTHVQRTLHEVDSAYDGAVLSELREASGTVTAQAAQALFADCLRVAYTAINADGELGDDELEAMYELLFTIARHYANTSHLYADYKAIDQESSRGFLLCYAHDRGPYGLLAKEPWPGLALCRRAAELGAAEPLERYEPLMVWLIDAACQVAKIDVGDDQQRKRVAHLEELRASLAAGARPMPSVDLRLQAFLGQRRVFHSVQDPSSLSQHDPFDVEIIHAEARAEIEGLVQRATTPALHGERGRMLLVLGDSGAGKTHLLRAVRRYVHEYGRGFVAYAQLQSSSEDYSRYLLQQVVTSLTLPYSGPDGERTGLSELANGLPRFGGPPLQERVTRLRYDAWDDERSLAEHVNVLVDELLGHRELEAFDPDLLRVLLYSLRPDHRITSRVYKYLRCEELNAYDRGKIGEVASRTGADHPRTMLRDLARLAFVSQQAAFVLMVDQAELAGFDDTSHAVFRRAIDALYGVVSEVPSAVAVIACLSDLYTDVRPKLTRSAVDRLESDPPIQRLTVGRTYPEIEAMIGRRLAWLYAASGAAYRADDPVYPIPPAFLRRLVNLRSRDVLDRCHELQQRSAAVGKIAEAHVESDDDVTVRPQQPVRATAPPRERAGTTPGVAPGPSPAKADEEALAGLEQRWAEAALGEGLTVPDEDADLLDLLAFAAERTAAELGISLATDKPRKEVLRVAFSDGSGQVATCALALTSRGPQGGAFAKQLHALQDVAGGWPAVAVRADEFPRGKATEAELAKHLKSGGRLQLVPDTSWRGLLAYRKFRPAADAVTIEAWHQRARPVSSLPKLDELFGLRDWILARSMAPDPDEGVTSSGEVVEAAPAEVTTPTPSAAPTAASSSSAEPSQLAPQASATTQPEAPAGQLYLGVSKGFQSEARWLDSASLLRHVGLLGSSGSGKTTLALNLLEQLLERDIAVVLVDRKGDLAGYAKPTWWQRTADPARAQRLAERLDVRLFTPGSRAGRPLSLSVVPDLQALPDHERERMVRYAAHSLGAMMRLGDSPNDAAKTAILAQAIAVLSERPAKAGLEQLLALLEDRDDALLARAGRFDDKLFKSLVQLLETLRLNDHDLFDSAAEVLSADALLARRDGRVPLVIASTRFLGDVERVQSWVANLIAALARHATRHPSPTLRTVFMIDEADQFLPAGTSKPPSKEPLQDLLKRARSAGLGVVLASQSAGDFDYKSRELIGSWFLGRIADPYAQGKMRPLFEHKPQLLTRLGTLEPGRFIALQEGRALELERAPSLLRTEQLSEQELCDLAAATQ